ncbi:MAG: DUF642 domain-containing protein, partial [Planctomycetaceae bacterium]|nr:DUF642 domain-containing protein [Planctomycetaceae bacterium]
INSSILSDSNGGGLVDVANANTKTDLNYVAHVDLGADVLLQADGDVSVLSSSKINSNAVALSDSRGFGTGATSNAPVNIGKSTESAKTITHVGPGVSIAGRNVSIDALVDGMSVNAEAKAYAGAFGASTEATSKAILYNQVNVVLDGSSSLAALQTVNVRARTTNVSLVADTKSEADAAFGYSDATSNVDYQSAVTVLASDNSTITAGNLVVDASQGISKYRRIADANFGGIGSEDENREGNLNAGRSVNWNADVSLVSPSAGTPKLVIAANGTILQSDSVTVNGGKRVGDSLGNPAVISVDPIINGSNVTGTATIGVNTLGTGGSIDSNATGIPQGSISGTLGSFNGPTAFSRVDIENQYNAPLVINDISVVSYQSNPDVRLNAQNVSLQFDIGTRIPALSEINIRQTGSAQPIRIVGVIDNPLGTTTIFNSQGDIIDGPSGIVRAGQIEIDAPIGAIGSTTNPLNLELIRSNVGQGSVTLNAGQNIDANLDGRVRDPNLSATFASRSVTAGGDASLTLSPVRKQIVPLGTAQVGVDVSVNNAPFVTYGTRYSTGLAASNIARDPRVFPDPAADTFVDAAFRFDQIVGNNITVVSTLNAASDPRNSVFARTNVRYDSRANDLSGDIRVVTGGNIELIESGELPVDQIVSNAGNVTLTAVGLGADIFDIAADDPSVAYVRGNHIVLTADGAIGTASDLLEIDSGVQAAGSVTASAKDIVALREVAGNLNVVTVVSNFSDVILIARGASILELGDDAQAEIQGRNLYFRSAGSVGTAANPIEIFGAGSSQAENEFQITASQPLAGRLFASATQDIQLVQVNADLDILQVKSTSGNVNISVNETVLTAGFFDGPQGEDIFVRSVGGTTLLGETVSQPSVTAAGSLRLSAGDQLRVEAGTIITAGSSIALDADARNDNPDPGIGATISVAGNLTANQITISGGADIDFIELLGSGFTSTNIQVYGEAPTLPANSSFGDDRFFIQAVKGGSSLTVDGGRGADQYFISSTASIARLTTDGQYDDATNVLGNLNGNLSTIAGAVIIETGAAGNQGTRDAIYLSAGNASGALAGSVVNDTVSGLGMSGNVRFNSTEGASVWLGLSAFNDTLQVGGLSSPFAAFVYAGNGNDTLNAYNANNRVNGIQGVVVYEGEDGIDTLNVRGNSTAQSSGMLTAISVNGMEMGTNRLYSLQNELGYPLDPSSATNGTAPASIYFGSRSGFEEAYQSTVEAVNVQLGDSDDIFQIDSTFAYGSRNVLGGDGNDRIVVGSSANGLFPNSTDRVDFISGRVVVDLQSGDSDTIVINDSGDSDANQGQINGNTVSGLGMATSLSTAGTELIEVLLGAQDDLFYVAATVAGQSYKVNLGGGFDTAYVGTTAGREKEGSLDSIKGSLSILGEGPESGDTLWINDQNSSIGHQYSVANAVTGVLNVIGGDDLPLDTTTVTRSGAASISYSRVETVALSAGVGADTIEIQGTHREIDPLGGKSATFTVNAGAGDDSIVLGTTTASGFSLDSFRIKTGPLNQSNLPGGIPVFVNGQEGTDSVQYLDTAATQSTLLSLTNVSFADIFPALPPASAGTADPGRVQLFRELLGQDPLATTYFGPVLGQAANTAAINVRELNTENVTISLGSGADVFTLSSGAYDRNITLNGGAGNDSVSAENGAVLGSKTFTFNGEAGDDILFADFAKATIVQRGALETTLIGVGVGVVSNEFLSFERGRLFVETRLNNSQWEFRVVNSAGQAQTISNASNTGRTSDWQAIPASRSFDTQRGIVLNFGGDSALFQAGSLMAGTATEILVGVPTSNLSLAFNGGTHDTVGDTLRVSGDGDTSGAVFRPSSALAGSGSLTLSNTSIAFAGLEPVIVHGLPDLQVRTADGDIADLTVGSTTVSDLSLSTVTLHTLVVEGVVSWKQEAKLTIAPVASTKEFGRTTAQDGNFLVVGSKLKDVAYGEATVYEWNGTGWTERAVLRPNDYRQGGGGDFGYSVAISGDTLLVGAPGDNERGFNAGAVYVFGRSGSSWSQQAKIVGSTTTSGNRFGTSVAISNDKLVVGQPGTNSGTDSNETAFFYVKSGNTWSERNRFSFTGDYGRAVSISGNRALVGLPDYVQGNGSPIGLVSYFEFDGFSWQFRQNFSPADPQNFERFGESVSINGNQFVIGAPGWDDLSVPDDANLSPPVSAKWDHGRALVFNRESGSWVLEARLTATAGLPANEASLEGNEFDRFGAAVSTFGNYVVVGAPGADVTPAVNSGAAYVYYRQPSAASGNGATWTRSSGASGPGKLTAASPAGADAGSGAPLPDNFGTAVSIFNNRIVVGIPGFNETDSLNNILQADVGSIRTFTTTGAIPQVSNESLRAEVLTGGANTGFGKTTVYDANTRTLFVAAPTEGRVYLYANEGLSWRFLGSLRPNANNAEFGASIAVSGNQFAVGAPGSNRVYVYTYNASQSWFTSPQEVSGSGEFGRDVDIRGNQLVVGAPSFNFGYNTPGNSGGFMNLSTPGAAFVFTQGGGGWQANRVLVPDDFNLPLTATQYYNVPITASAPGVGTLGAASAVLFLDSNFRGTRLWFYAQSQFQSTGVLDDEASSLILGPYTRVILRDTATGSGDKKEADVVYENYGDGIMYVSQVGNNDDHEQILVESIGPTFRTFSRTVGVPYSGVISGYDNVSFGRWGSQVSFLDGDTIAVGAPNRQNVSVYELARGNDSNLSTNAGGFIPLRVNSRTNGSGFGGTVVDAGGSVFAVRTSAGLQLYGSTGNFVGSANLGSSLNTNDPDTMTIRGNVTAIGNPQDSSGRGVVGIYGTSRPNGSFPSLFLTPYTVSGNSLVSDNTASRGFGNGTSLISENFYVVGTDPTNSSLDARLYNFRMRGPAWDAGSTVVPTAPPIAKLGSAVALRDSAAAVGAQDYDERGAVFIFRAEKAPSDQRPIATLQPNDIGTGDGFGSSVSMYGGSQSLSLVAGSPQSGNGRGSAYVFTGIGESWTQETKFVGDNANELFGAAVAISGNTAVIGAPNGNSVYVFVRDGINWTRQFKAVGATVNSVSDRYGTAVAIDGDRMLVGAPGNAKVDIWERTGTTWNLVDQVFGAAGSGFGSTVSISGQNIVIGAPNHDQPGKIDAGEAYVYEKRVGQFVLTATLSLGNDAAAQDRFGTSVVIEDQRILVGAPGRDHRFATGDTRVDSGETFAYSLKNGQWLLETNVDPLFGSDAQAGDQMGYAVALSGNLALVGAPQLNGRPNSTDTDGAGYAYLRSVGSPSVVIYPEEQAILLAGAQANTISGTVGGTSTSVLTFFDVNNVSIYTGFRDDILEVGEEGLTAYGLENFSVDLDGGEDTLIVKSSEFDPTEKGNLIFTGDVGGLPDGSTLPSNMDSPYRSSEGSFEIDGGSGNNFLDVADDTDWTLTQTKLTSRPGDTANIENFRKARLTGGASENVIQVKGFDGAVEVDGGDGHDEYTIVDTQSAKVTDNNSSSNIFTVVGTSGNDSIQITDNRVIVNGLVYDITNIDTVRVAGGSGNDSFEINAVSTSTTIFIDGQDGSDFYLANIGTNVAGSLIRVTDTGSNPFEQDRLRLDVGTSFANQNGLLRATNNDGVLLYDGTFESVAVSGIAVDEGSPSQSLPLSQFLRNYNPVQNYAVTSSNSSVVTVALQKPNLTLDFGIAGSSIITITNTNTGEIERFLVSVRSIAPTLTIDAIEGVRSEGSQLTVRATGVNSIGGLSYSFRILKNGEDFVTSEAQATGIFPFTPDDNGTYTVEATVTDQRGNSATVTVDVTVGNVNPNLVLQDVEAIVEGGEATLRGSYSDPGSLDTHELLVNWGDGTFDRVPVSDGTFALTHKYLDDNAGDLYQISATLVDKDSGSISQAKSVVVTNVNPELTLTTIAPISENEEAVLRGIYSDAGELDTHTVDIDWGDGTIEYGVSVTGGIFERSHRYLDDNADDLYQVRVTLRDDDGGVAQQSEVVAVTNTNPLNTANAVAAILENGIARLTGTFSDVGTLDTHVITINWGDGNVEENIPVSGGAYDFSHRYLDDNLDDLYDITVTVIDKDGGAAIEIVPVVVTNVDPVIRLNAVSSIDENGVATLTGTITDPGTLDTFTVQVNWGDPLSPNNIETYTLSASSTGTQSFTWTHRYLDDNPSNSISDVYTISASVTDKDGGVGFASETVSVNNVKPVLELNDVETIIENGVAVLTGRISDIGTLDSFTVVVNWGDPLSPNNIEIYTFNATQLQTQTFRFEHRYLDDNPTATYTDRYTISVRVTDDDGQFDEGSKVVTVNNVAPTLSLDSVQAIVENGVAVLTGRISDPGTLDTFTVVVNWGDPLSPNNVETYTFNAIQLQTQTFRFEHRYLDDNPTSTGSDQYTIKVRVTDDDGQWDEKTTPVIVSNVAPVIETLFARTLGDNLILNGDFEKTPNLNRRGQNNQFFGIFNSSQVPGWRPTGAVNSIEIQEGDHGTGNADLNQVAELDAGREITQTFTVLRAGDYLLSLDVAKRNTLAANNGVAIYVDGQLLATIQPTLNSLVKFNYNVALAAGSHTLRLVGLSSSSADGSVVDNVSVQQKILLNQDSINGIDRSFDSSNLFVNSNFQNTPPLTINGQNGTFWDTFANGLIPGWKATGKNNTIEIQEGNFGTGVVAGNRVAELDRDRSIAQTVTIAKPGRFVLSLDVAKRLTDNKNNGIEVRLNGEKFAEILPTLNALTNYSFELDLFAGEHTFEFVSLSNSRDFGSVIDNVVLRQTAALPTMQVNLGVNSDGSVNLDGVFSDIGSLDTHRVTVEWGDGTSEILYNFNSTGRAYAGSHFYQKVGVYEIKLTLLDDDGGVDTTTAFVAIRGTNLINGVLYVIGSDLRDVIDVDWDCDKLEVRLGNDDCDDQVVKFPLAAVRSILVSGGFGNDSISIDRPASIPVKIQDDGGDNCIDADEGQELVIAGAGNDHIDLGDGLFWIDAGNGNNDIEVGDGHGEIISGSGFDEVETGAGNHVIRVGHGGSRIDIDGDGNNLIVAGDGDNRIETRNGNQDITTGAGNDYIYTKDGNVFINAGHGNNTIYAGDGFHRVITGSGRDIVNVDDGDFVIEVGDGTNEVRIGNGNGSIAAGLGYDTIYAGQGNHNINVGHGGSYIDLCGTGDNEITAGDGNNTVLTGNGRQVITTGNGNDYISTGNGDVNINAGEGNNTIYAQDGFHRIRAGAGRDIICV